MYKKIQSIKPDLIGFSITTHQVPYAKIYSNWIKEDFDIPIIIGGSHVTLCPSEVIEWNSIDMICIGEGEYPMLELANNLEREGNITKILNLWVKWKGKLYRNKLRSLINLDELPFPDRDFDPRIRQTRIGDMIAGRGCPFNCSYCCNHIFRKIFQGRGKYVRYRSVENV